MAVKKPAPPRPGVYLALACSCGSTLRGTVSAPITDAFQIRDLFLNFHRGDGCSVTDNSKDVP